MAGILDKKSRFIDYTHTKFGKESLLEKGQKACYVSLSDADIVYVRDYEDNELYRSYLSDLKNNLTFEADTSSQLKFNRLAIDNQSVSYNKLTFNKSESGAFEINRLIQHTFSNKIKSGFLIETNEAHTEHELNFKITCNRLNNRFDFIGRNQINKYTTLHEYDASIKEIPAIMNDTRFSNMHRFMKMSPVTSDGTKIVDENENIESDLSYVFKSYKSYKGTQVLEREAAIRNIIKSLENDSNIMKKTYELIDTSGKDDFIYEMFEIDEKSSEDVVKAEKLVFVDLGEIYDNMTGNMKNIYLIGKLINTKLYDANMQEANNNFENSSLDMFVSLSGHFSFVNMFTMIAE